MVLIRDVDFRFNDRKIRVKKKVCHSPVHSSWFAEFVYPAIPHGTPRSGDPSPPTNQHPAAVILKLPLPRHPRRVFFNPSSPRRFSPRPPPPPPGTAARSAGEREEREKKTPTRELGLNKSLLRRSPVAQFFAPLPRARTWPPSAPADAIPCTRCPSAPPRKFYTIPVTWPLRPRPLAAIRSSSALFLLRPLIASALLCLCPASRRIDPALLLAQCSSRRGRGESPCGGKGLHPEPRLLLSVSDKKQLLILALSSVSWHKCYATSYIILRENREH